MSQLRLLTLWPSFNPCSIQSFVGLYRINRVVLQATNIELCAVPALDGCLLHLVEVTQPGALIRSPSSLWTESLIDF